MDVAEERGALLHLPLQFWIVHPYLTFPPGGFQYVFLLIGQDAREKKPQPVGMPKKLVSEKL